MKVALCLLVLVTAASACREVDVEMSAYGIDATTVRFEMNELGALDADALAERKSAGDIDGMSLLDESVCKGPCRVVELTVFIENKGSEAMAPPVVRLQTPKAREPRLPVAFRALEISPARIGRIRWLVSLYPEEEKLVADVSGSVAFSPGSSAP